MWDLIPGPVKNFLDSIFAPPMAFLDLMSDTLNQAGTVVGRGINLNNYFGFFGYLPAAWQNVVSSALASITLLAILWLVRAVWNMYLKTKESGKWW